jgi:hypothetical protein
MRQINEPAIPLQTAANITSSAIPSLNLVYMSAQIVSTGAPSGTLKFQVSNDDPQDGTQPANWSDLTGASVTVSGSGAVIIPKTDCCYQWVRLVYTNVGTGTIAVRFKALGA